MHAEPLLLVDDRERKVLERNLLLEQGVGAYQQIEVSRSEAVEHLRPLAPALAAGQDRDADTRGFRERRDGVEMLPGQDLGRRHQRRLAAGFDHVRGRQQRDHGLAGSHVALQQAEHALRFFEIRGDFLDGAPLRRGQRIGQRLDNLLPQPAGTRARASGLPAHVRARERERKLAGEKLVEREPRPMRGFGNHVRRLGRPMQFSQGIRERRPSLSGEPCLVLPFRQRRQLRQRRFDRPVDLAVGETFGERIDRLDARQVGKAFLVDHAVGMHHLQHAVVEAGGARDVAQLADRQQPLQIRPLHVEIGDDEIAGVVAGVDQVRRARAMRRRRPVPLDPHRDRDQRTGNHVGEPGAGAPIDGPGRQVEQQIDESRAVAAEQLGVKLLLPHPDAGERGHGCEQWIENARAHALLPASRNRIVARREPAGNDRSKTAAGLTRCTGSRRRRRAARRRWWRMPARSTRRPPCWRLLPGSRAGEGSSSDDAAR